eukprot:TRINITY_DN10681_c0_g1_i1.p1 TRINITY_DN10681_c0_g1~~TRINITY_DN10681_c0_g1_i1.p1  ORF type:complete len:418 (+),score=27.00 TRINITY_DN10681_c0_g1_i1:53-1255(+)
MISILIHLLLSTFVLLVRCSCDTSTFTDIEAALDCTGTVTDGDVCHFSKSGYICDVVECVNGTWNLSKPGCQVKGQPVGAYIDFTLEVPLSSIDNSEMQKIVGDILGSPILMQRVQSRALTGTATRIRVEFYIKAADRTYNDLAEEATAKLQSAPSIPQKYNKQIQDMEVAQTQADEIPVVPTPKDDNNNGGETGTTRSPSNGNTTNSAPDVPQDDSSNGFPWIILAAVLGMLLLCGLIYIAYRIVNKKHAQVDEHLENPLPMSEMTATVIPPHRSVPPRRKVVLAPLHHTDTPHTYEAAPATPLTPTLTPIGHHMFTPTQRVYNFVEGTDTQIQEVPRGLSASNRSMGSLSLSRTGKEFPTRSPVTPSAGFPSRSPVTPSAVPTRSPMTRGVRSHLVMF